MLEASYHLFLRFHRCRRYLTHKSTRIKEKTDLTLLNGSVSFKDGTAV